MIKMNSNNTNNNDNIAPAGVSGDQQTPTTATESIVGNTQQSTEDMIITETVDDNQNNEEPLTLDETTLKTKVLDTEIALEALVVKADKQFDQTAAMLADIQSQMTDL